VTTRYERAKTQARIERVLADIRRLEAQGLGWVGAPAGITRTMPAPEDRRPIPIGIGLVARAKARAFTRPSTRPFAHPPYGVEGPRVIRAL